MSDAAASERPVTRRLNHPGPLAPVRREAVRGNLSPISGVLRPGQTFMAAVTQLFADAGYIGGVLNVRGGACDPFHYVLPAFSTDAEHAAWYSETHVPESGGRFVDAVAIVGKRSGESFLHCHGIWETEGGEASMGHLLPFDSVISEPIPCEGYGSADATFDRVEDPETNFSNFSARGESQAGDGLLVRIRPHEDVGTALEEVCTELGLGNARVYGIGSINEPSFDDGRRVACHATEIMIEDGLLKTTPDGLRAQLNVALVDVNGTIYHGQLARGDNPVAVTFELVVVGDREDASWGRPAR